MRKAYDSVSIDSLKLALTRIDLPTPFVNWIANLFSGRKMAVITHFGLSNYFTGNDGIDQGDAISPLLWRIFYDPMLIAIQRKNTAYTMEVPCWNSVNDLHPTFTLSASIPVLAYMDDTSFISPAKTLLQAAIDTANEFYSIHDIHINGSKSDLIILNSDIPEDEKWILVGQQLDKAYAVKKDIRYLGAYFNSNHRRRQWKERISTIITDFIAVIDRKMITISQIVYLINKILIPRIVYIAQIMTLTETDWDSLFRPVIMLVKKKSGLPKSTPTAALYHDGILGLVNPWHQLCANLCAEFNIRINNSNSSLAAITTQIRLRQAQININSPSSIYRIPREELPHIWPFSKHNNNLFIICIAKSIHIEFKSHPLLQEKWHIDHGLPITAINYHLTTL